LYVWQTLFLQVGGVSFSREASGPGQLLFYVVDLLLIALLSIGTHYLVELPLQNVGRRLSADLRIDARPSGQST
jgi:peptidoglycan/LPS O-acetylase OafA/YrhL